MDSFPKLPADRQSIFFQEGQQRLGLASASIEKDFWVCWTLQKLFSLPEWGEHLTFKGGTSLSKCWKLISRFSEDIDIVIDRDYLGFGEETLSNNRQKKLVRRCRQRIHEELRPLLYDHLRRVLPGDREWDLIPADEDEAPDQQTLLFQYPSVFVGTATYLRPVVKIEMGARSETVPVEAPSICPYLAEAFPDLLYESSFPIRTEAARRTFWEKAVLLHEEASRPSDRPRRARMSRHYYDLWCLITKKISDEAISDTGLFERVVHHNSTFFGKIWVDYSLLHKGNLRLMPRADQLAEWRKDYESMRKEMFVDEPPKFDEILAVIQQFEEYFNRV